MRRTIMATILAAYLSLALGGAALAAPAASQTIDIVGSASFASILGGSTNGTVTLTGEVSNGELGTLKGAVNVPLRDLSLTVEPTTTIAFTPQRLFQSWQYLDCQPMFCTWVTGVATWEYQRAQGPVDIRLGQMRGTGTINLNTSATCVASCPPPQAYYQPIYPGVYINGAVLGSKDAGSFGLNGTNTIR
jgi:hypothetical protein